MPTFLTDDFVNSELPKVVTTAEQRWKLRLILERSDLVRIADAAAALRDKLLELAEASNTKPTALRQLSELTIRLASWKGPMPPQENLPTPPPAAPKDRKGGSSRG